MAHNTSEMSNGNSSVVNGLTEVKSKVRFIVFVTTFYVYLYGTVRTYVVAPAGLPQPVSPILPTLRTANNWTRSILVGRKGLLAARSCQPMQILLAWEGPFFEH